MTGNSLIIAARGPGCARHRSEVKAFHHPVQHVRAPSGLQRVQRSLSPWGVAGREGSLQDRAYLVIPFSTMIFQVVMVQLAGGLLSDASKIHEKG